MPKFDPIAVGDKIAEHIVAADQAKGAIVEHSKAAGALLIEVQDKHPKHLKAICDRIGLGRSRVYELMQIAGGRKTAEQVKAATAKRVQRHRARKKPEPASVTSDVTDAVDVPSPPVAIPFPSSKRALAEFKIAVDHWMPKMTAAARAEAVDYVVASRSRLSGKEIAS
jgi:hypothetical protein